MHVCACHGMRVKVGGQLVGVIALLHQTQVIRLDASAVPHCTVLLVPP